MSESADGSSSSPERQYFRREIRGLANHIEMEDPLLKLAEEIFKQGLEAGVPVDSWSRYSAACLLTAAKLRNLPIEDERFADGARNTKKSLIKKVQLISKRTGIEVAPREPEPFIKKYLDELDLDPEVRERAFEIAEEAKEEILGSGISPTSYAAAVIYISDLERGGDLTQSDVAKVSGKSEVTIRNRYQDIVEVVEAKPGPRRGRNRREKNE